MKEFIEIARALDTIDEAAKRLLDIGANVNYFSAINLVACNKQTREALKVVTIGRPDADATFRDIPSSLSTDSILVTDNG